MKMSQLAKALLDAIPVVGDLDVVVEACEPSHADVPMEHDPRIETMVTEYYRPSDINWAPNNKTDVFLIY